MKTISIVVPTYNEEENVSLMAQTITTIFENDLYNYNLELIFIDNHSKDNTRNLLRNLCAKWTNV